MDSVNPENTKNETERPEKWEILNQFSLNHES